jgi:hypothetical protein
MPAGRSASDGAFSIDGLAPGPWELRVGDPAHPPARVSGECDGLECSGLELRVPDGGTISGRVDHAAQLGEPLVVRARLVRPKGTKHDAELLRMRTVPVAADGSFVLRGLPRVEGHWVIGGWLERAQTSSSVPVTQVLPAQAGESALVLAWRDTTSLRFSAAIEGATPELREPRLLLTVNAGGSTYQTTDVPAPERRADGYAASVRLPLDTTKVKLELNALGFAPTRKELAVEGPGDTLDFGELALKRVPIAIVHVVDHDTQEPIAGATVQSARGGG